MEGLPGAASPDHVLLDAELEQRRGRRLFALALAAAMGTVASVAVIDADSRGSSDSTLMLCLVLLALVVGTSCLAMALLESQQIAYLGACLRYFADPSAETLLEIRKDDRWRPHGALLGERGWVAVGIAVVLLVVAGVYLLASHHALWQLAVVVALLAAGLFLMADCLLRFLPGWNTAVEQLAKGIRTLHDGNASAVKIDGTETLKVTQSDGERILLVRRDDQLPAPRYAARAFFGRAYRELDEENGWARFGPAQGGAAAALDEGAASAAPALTPQQRIGPLVAAALAVVAALLLTLSVLAGTPDKLPGWALDSELLYEAARAGLGLLGLAVLTNLIMALGAGRLLQKVSQTGLEWDAAAAATPQEVKVGDKGNKELIEKVETQVRDVREGLSLVGADIAELRATLQALEQPGP